jgi:hypothetical protein
MPTLAANPANPGRYNWLMFGSIGAVACAAADLTHEVLGHIVASRMVGVPVLALSTVGMQTPVPNRFISAAGTLANVIAGSAALGLSARTREFSSWVLFLWAFGAVNLLDTGYLVASAVMGSGDWSVVIAGLMPAWLWRVMLALVGWATYALSVRWIRHCADRIVHSGSMSVAEVKRFAWSVYVTGGIVLTLAAALNPFSRMLILVSGLGASLGLTWGMLLVPSRDIEAPANTSSYAPRAAVTLGWTALAVLVAGVFIALLGPGVRFDR